MADPDRGNDLERVRKENERLHSAIEELSILNDIAVASGSTSSLDRIIELIVRKCIKHLRVEQALITLLDTKQNGEQFRTMIRSADSSHEIRPYRLDAEIAGWMIKNRTPLIVNDLASDGRFKMRNADDYHARSVLSAPLLLKGNLIGLLNLFNKKTGDFTEADARLLGIIAAQSAQIIENARLAAEEQALQLMQEEMRLACKIQTDLLPKASPTVPGYDIAGTSIPAKMVGGDYFDFIRTSDRSIALCLGDVSGKGMPAALLMANLQATLRAQAAVCTGPKECLERSNALLYRSTDADKFATLFYAILDTEIHRLTYANAGHNYPMLFKVGCGPELLETSGLVLGCIEDFRYSEGTIALAPGDLLVIYSDGITESLNEREEEYGDEKLSALLREQCGKCASEIITAIVASVRAHAGAAPQSDDITLLVIRREC